ncbi:MAG: metal-dependent transcriptional regulator [Gemmatimonadota bacterium]
MNAIPDSRNLSRSVEDYLKAVYSLTQHGESASTSALAESLDVAPPSVSGMIRRLSEQGLLNHVPYQGVALTEAGRRAALKMVRRHRIIEAYLVDQLDYTWDSVHDEAERLEHAVSDTLIERMAEALGSPQFDPHGDPIPDAQGRIAELSYTPLCDVPDGETVQVHRVMTRQADHLRYIGASGLTPGAPVTVVRREPFNGPLTVRHDGGEQVVAHAMAGLIMCVRPDLPTGL